MNIKIQLIIIAGAIIILSVIFYNIKKKRIDIKYSLPWIVVDFIVLILGIFPQISGRISGLLGISTPINMLFFFGICFALVLIFHLASSVSRLSEKVKRLTQVCAIMDNDLKNRKIGKDES